jgi:hypothetical protein
MKHEQQISRREKSSIFFETKSLRGSDAFPLGQTGFPEKRRNVKMNLSMHRFLFSSVAALAGLSAGPAFSVEKTEMQDRPNIIMILSDDIGYGDFGCYGATKTKTPNVDKLAASGILFTSAYAPAATCTPT